MRVIFVVAGVLAFFGGMFGAEVLVLQESFETDGAGTRYEVVAGGDDGDDAYWARKEVESETVRASAEGTFHGAWIWGGNDINDVPGPRGDAFPGEGMDEYRARLKFHSVDVEGLGNLKISLAAAIGIHPGAEPDDGLLIRVRFDGGSWRDVGGFKSAGSNNRLVYYSGPQDTFITKENPNRLSDIYSSWSWDIIGRGAEMDVDLTFRSNHLWENIYFDSIRIIGNNTVSFFGVDMAHDALVEPEDGYLENAMEICLESPAPAGGVTFAVSGSKLGMASVEMPEKPIFIPEGENKIVVPFRFVQDGRFTGEKTVDLTVTAPGYNTESAGVIVENISPPPKIVMTEVYYISQYNVDVNGDGLVKWRADEFVELVNLGDKPVNLSGWQLRAEGYKSEHLFPEGTVLYPSTAIVVFRGGEPRGNFGGAQVQTLASSLMTLSLSNFRILTRYALHEPYGAVYDFVDLPLSGRDFSEKIGSVHRTEDVLTVQGLVLDEDYIHTIIEGADQRLFSPGTWYDGTPYFDPENEISLSVNRSVIREDDGQTAATGTITLANPAPAGGLVVELETDGVRIREDGTLEPDEIDLDSVVVVVPEGKSSADFRIGAVHDRILDGDQEVTLTARAGPYVLPDFVEFSVQDVDLSTETVVINEILNDAHLIGQDFNLDGELNDDDDQFVELVNISGHPVNMSGWQLTWEYVEDVDWYEELVEMHTFLPGTWVPDGGAVVVFGRISNEATRDSVFGGAIVQRARSAEGFSNPDGLALAVNPESSYPTWRISLINQHGGVVDIHDNLDTQLAGQNQSMTLAPDITGELTLHKEVNGVIASPGLTIQGEPFSGSGVVKLPQTFAHVREAFQGGWFVDPTFGWLAAGPPLTYDLPWVYSLEHATYWYVHSASQDTQFWIYDQELSGWFYTNYTFYPWVWLNATKEWVVR